MNCLSKQESGMVGTDEPSVRALDGVRMFGFLAPILTLNRQVALVPVTSVTSDIRQKLKNVNCPSLS